MVLWTIKQAEPVVDHLRVSEEPAPRSRLSAAETGWFHGGIPGLRPGQLLRPRSEVPAWTALRDLTAGHAATGGAAAACCTTLASPHTSVAITTDPWAALAYAGDHQLPWPAMNKTLRVAGDLYRVHPLCNPHTCPTCLTCPATARPRGTEDAHLLADPDFPDQPDRFARIHHAVVLEVIHERVELTERDFVRLMAPHQSWGPGDAVYDGEGYLQPSPSMRAAGCTATELARFGRWVPLSEVHHDGVPMRWRLGWGRSEEMRRQGAPWREALQLAGKPLGRFAAAAPTFHPTDCVEPTARATSTTSEAVPPEHASTAEHRDGAEEDAAFKRGITRRWRRRWGVPPQRATPDHDRDRGASPPVAS